MVFKRQAAPILACLALVACAIPTVPVATAQITPAPTVIVPHRNPVLVQYCVDDTGSYPREDFYAANRLVANSLIQSVVPNSDGLVLYATLITSNTFDSSNTAAPFVIPHIENYPALPTPIPSPSQVNPVSYPATATAHAAKSAPAIATYNAESMSVNVELNTVKNQVARDVNRLITWNPPVDNNATSVWGCLQLARGRLQGQPGTKYLIIASDMENNTNVDFTQDFFSSHALKGIDVHVIYYPCEMGQGAGDCQQRAIYWRDVVNGSNAHSVRFDDPAQSQTITNLFG